MSDKLKLVKISVVILQIFIVLFVLKRYMPDNLLDFITEGLLIWMAVIMFIANILYYFLWIRKQSKQ